MKGSVGIMRCIKNKSSSAYYNFACEEYFMENFEEPIFMLWENEKCVMVGKTQNTYAEVNLDYVKKHKINVIRRQSGGGTIYTSKGVIQFSFIFRRDDSILNEKMREYIKPLRDYLDKIGVHSEFSGRNDVLINGLKVNGNAQAYTPNVMLHHGSILFDSDLTHIEHILTPKKEKLKAKGIKSVKSRMTLIKHHLKSDMTAEEFLNGFFKYVLETYPGAYEKEISFEEDLSIKSISEKKWETWSWNFGRNPQFDLTCSKKYPYGLIEIGLSILKGHIKDIRIYGDYFGKKDIGLIENLLIGTKFSFDEINMKLDKINIGDYIDGMKKEDFIRLILQEN